MPWSGRPRVEQHRAGAVAEQRVGLDVVGVEDARVAVAADDEGSSLAREAT